MVGDDCTCALIVTHRSRQHCPLVCHNQSSSHESRPHAPGDNPFCLIVSVLSFNLHPFLGTRCHVQGYTHACAAIAVTEPLTRNRVLVLFVLIVFAA